MSTQRERQPSPYATHAIDAIGDTTAEAVIDPMTGVVLSGTPLTTLPEPKAGSLDAALVAIRRASRDDSGIPEDW